jgi:hypothetical protein
MVLRGYGQAGQDKGRPRAGRLHAQRGDALALVGALLVAAVLVAAQVASQRGLW